MKDNKVLQTVLTVVVLVIFEGFFMLIAPKLWGPDVAYDIWGKANLAACVVIIIASIVFKQRKKKVEM